jgi:hypothetical protein
MVEGSDLLPSCFAGAHRRMICWGGCGYSNADIGSLDAYLVTQEADSRLTISLLTNCGRART